MNVRVWTSLFGRWLPWCAVLAVAAWPSDALACAACLGAPDSPLTQGLNIGILSLLLVVLTVLGGVAAFFIYLARRAAAARESELSESLNPAAGKAH